MTSEGVNRRILLRGALGGAALVAGGATGVAGCGKRTTSAGTANNAAVKLPTYTPFAGGPKPDLPGAPGQLDGFLTYPAQPLKLVSAPPGDGSAVTAFLQTYSPVAPGLGSNRYWQALNQALGVDLRISVVPAGDYNDKFATVVAGDLPDLLHVRTSVVDVPALLAAKCQDLTPYLSGDAVREYPFLANIPTAAWQASCIHNGGIYGVPVPRAVLGQTFFRRDDILAAKGLNPDPASFAEFRKLCQDLTDTRRNQWALSSADAAFLAIMQMLGAPNMTTNQAIGGWRNDGGKLTNSYELEQTKQALSDTAALVKAGTVHPDSFGGATQDLTTNYKQWFNAGSAALHGDNYPAWWQFYVQNVAGPGFKVGAFLPPNYDAGTTAVTWQGNPAFSYTAVKKAGAARIKQLLKLCNWLAAPFGSAEYLMKNYGVEGVDWQRNAAGDAALTTTGQGEVPGLAAQYICSPPYVLYYAGQAQATRDIYAYEQKFIPKAVQDPTLGLDSATASRVGGTLQAMIVDARHAVMRGQQPVASWDETMKQWRSAGGDQIRGEFEHLLQHTG
jgi:putative aldouronate transport system substrate-binding protein